MSLGEKVWQILHCAFPWLTPTKNGSSKALKHQWKLPMQYIPSRLVGVEIKNSSFDCRPCTANIYEPASKDFSIMN